MPERDAVAVALDALRRRDAVDVIPCGCTNLPPHSDAIAAAAGLPVHDAVGLVEVIARGLASWRTAPDREP